MAKNCEIKFRQMIHRKALLFGGDRIIVAASGGVDSMVLLDLMARLSKSENIELSVAHINYGLRGTESDRDEDLVRERCERYGIPCDVLKTRLNNADNLQNEARRVRYAFFKECAKKRDANVIATAHHRDDQAETVLMHLMRGAGLQGLCGMSYADEMDDGTKLIRPMLPLGRDEIAKYAAERRVRYAEDATNKETRYNRNAVRHTLLPAMEEFNPQIRDHLSNMAVRLREDEEVLASMAGAFCSEHLILREPRAETRAPNAVEFSLAEYERLQPAIRRRVLIAAYEVTAGSRANLNSDQLQRMDEIAHSASVQGEYQLPGSYKFERDYNRLRILPPA